MGAIQLIHASSEIQETVKDLDADDKVMIGSFLEKVADYRSLLQRGDSAAAGRYHESLLSEVDRLRDHYADMKTYVAGGAAGGAAAGAWLFGVGAVVGGLAGGAVGYLMAKDRKDKMLKLCDALLLELGPKVR